MSIDGVQIYSDSMSSLQALENSDGQSKLLDGIYELIQPGDKFHWVRAHTGLRGNEAADIIAKNATEMTDVTESYPVTKIQFKNYLGKLAIDTWQRRWDMSDKGRCLYQFLTKVNRKRVLFRTFT